MWIDSGAGLLSLAAIAIKFLTALLLFLVICLFLLQYLRRRSNKPLNKIVSGFGILISFLIFLINGTMVFDHIAFMQEQIAIVNNPQHYAGSIYLREQWIETAKTNILFSICVTVVFGLLPLWLFYRQYISKNILKNDA